MLVTFDQFSRSLKQLYSFWVFDGSLHFHWRSHRRPAAVVTAWSSLSPGFHGWLSSPLWPLPSISLAADSHKMSSLSKHCRYSGFEELVLLCWVNLRYKIGILGWGSSFPLAFLPLSVVRVCFILHYLLCSAADIFHVITFRIGGQFSVCLASYSITLASFCRVILLSTGRTFISLWYIAFSSPHMFNPKQSAQVLHLSLVLFFRQCYPSQLWLLCL